MEDLESQPLDMFVIGGGVNGTGIARDAAGRGLSVALAEQGDLGGATSSASTKLFHGGLRYLEYGEIPLVFESLHERRRLRAAGHWLQNLFKQVMVVAPCKYFALIRYWLTMVLYI